MGRYQLVAKDDMKHDGMEIIKLCYSGSTPKLNEKFDLFEIDAVTLPYSCLRDLASALVLHGCIKHEMYIFKIAYIHNKETKHLNVIINDPFLLKCAKYCCAQKRQGKKGSKINLSPNIDGFTEYVSTILTYMKQEASSQIMIENHNGLLPYRLIQMIPTYRMLCQQKFLSPEEMDEIKQIKKQVIYILQKYKNLRGIKIWESLYLQGKLLPKKKVSTSEKKVIFKGSIVETNHLLDSEDSTDPDEFAFYSPEEMKYFTSGEEEATYQYMRK